MASSATVNRIVQLQNELIDARIERDDYRSTLEEIYHRTADPDSPSADAAGGALERWDNVRERGLLNE
jgi:hypothetical protein